MNTTTKSRFWQILVWLAWFLILLTCARQVDWPESSCNGDGSFAPLLLPAPEPLDGLAVSPPGRLLFPWWPRFRWRKRALARYRAWQKRFRRARWAYHRAVWATRLARLSLAGAMPFAALVDWLTRSQLRRQLGALPVLYAVLEILQVRQIINQHCPQGKAEIDHGTVALVLILNRLTAPRPLHRLADWLAQTCLALRLGLSADKFNDDRLRRTLEALHPHLQAIWQDIVHQALLHFDIDLRVIFYDLTAFIVHGECAPSTLRDFGFAHNTPMGKRKFKASLNTTADGGLPVDYELWPGSTADMATVQDNMERLQQLLARHGYPADEVLIVGDRANLSAELAFAYDRQQKETGLSYLCGLEARQKEHRQLLEAYPDSYFRRRPLGPAGYYGLPCPITFRHPQNKERKVTHRGLIVLSQPMQRACREGRSKQLAELAQELAQVRAKIGQRSHRTVAQVQQRAQTRLRRSPVGHLVCAWAVEEAGRIELRWQVDQAALEKAMRSDGRYLLVTNHPTLPPPQMLALYRQKDIGEKNFTICKKDLRVSPVYLHSDERIAAMLLLHMLALLTYNVLQRQARQHGLNLTTRRIIAALESLTVIETHCWDSSVLVRLAPVSEEQVQLLQALAQVLKDMRWPRLRPVLPPTPLAGALPGLSPGPPVWEDLPLALPAT